MTPSDTPFQVVNPATGQTGALHPFAQAGELDKLLRTAIDAQTRWAATSVGDRVRLLHGVAQHHRDHLELLAQTAVREMGKPISQARAEVDFSADIYDYYAQNAEQLLQDEPITLDADAGSAILRAKPVGVILGIMPWNFPFYQVARFAAPSIAVGNTVFFKPAPQCPESSQHVHDAFLSAGAPAGVFTRVLASQQAIADLIVDPRIAGVSFTGSARAGEVIGRLAGGAIKKTVLELGGSDPFLVLDGTNLDAALDAAVEARLDNGGQSCNGAKRIIVIDALYDDFVTRFVDRLAATRTGDPTDEDTVLGPLSSLRAAQTLEDQVRRAVDTGATVLLAASRDGAYVTCGVLADVTASNAVYDEELFGPVAVVHRAASEDDAVRIANDTPYGLGSYVFTGDPVQANRVANALHTGMVFVNGVGLDAPNLPFGGTKKSGTGRELGTLGIKEFINYQLIRAVNT